MIRLMIVGRDAVDIARLAKLPLNHLLDKPGTSPVIHPDAVRDPDNMCLDLSRLSWWDAWKVAWCRIGGHYYIRYHQEGSPCSSSPQSASRSSTSSAATSKVTTSDLPVDTGHGRAVGGGHRSAPGSREGWSSMGGVLPAGHAPGRHHPAVDATLRVRLSEGAHDRKLLRSHILRGAYLERAPDYRSASPQPWHQADHGLREGEQHAEVVV